MKVKIIYCIALLLLGNAGCKKESGSTSVLEQGGDPVADFSWTGTQSAPALITFSDLSSNSESLKWDFGNGSQSSQQSPDRILYTNPGHYEVFLRASMGDKQSITKKNILITKDRRPTAHFSYAFKDKRSYAPAVLKMENNSVFATSYEWKINGVTYQGKSADFVILHTAGDHLISLTAINGSERSQPFEQIVHVSESDEPVSGFVLPYHPLPYRKGEEIQLYNTSLNSDSWFWEFGSGEAQSKEENPKFIFEQAGTYKLKLVASKGQKIALPKTIWINVIP